MQKDEQDDKQVEDWELHPFFIQRAPTEAEIQRNVALQAVKAMILNGTPQQQRNSFREQGNFCIEEALKHPKDSKQFQEELYKAIRLYSHALTIEIVPVPEENFYQLDIDKQSAVIYTNRSEAYRLLGDYYNAVLDAQQALELDKNYNKPYVRMARISQDLGDHLRALYYFEKANKGTYSKALIEQQRIEEEIVKQMHKESQELFNHIKSVYKRNFKLGTLFPFINMPIEQRIQSFRVAGCTVYLLDMETKEVLTIEDVEYGATIKQMLDFINMPGKTLAYERPWCDEFSQERFVPQGNPGRRLRVSLRGDETLEEVLCSSDYVVPGVACFYLQ